MKSFLFATDPHGNMDALDRLFSIAEERKLDVILGGDLTPKLLAVKLSDYDPTLGGEDDDLDREPNLLPGEVIPLDMLRQKPPSNTYTEALRGIERLNRVGTPAELARALQRRGYIIHPVETEYFDFRGMMQENVLIDALCRFFRQAEGVMRHESPLEIGEEQHLELDLLVERMRQMENELTHDQRENLAGKWSRKISAGSSSPVPQYSFWRLCQSTTIPLYVEFRGKLGALEAEYRRISKLVGNGSIDRTLTDYFSQQLLRGLEDVRLAYRVVEQYSSDFFERLADISLARELTDKFGLDRSFKIYIEGQKKFLRGDFKERLHQFKHRNPALSVYAILGNDDVTDCDTEFQSLHEEGLLISLHGDPVEFSDGVFIAGYPNICPGDGGFYSGREKPEEEILSRLEAFARITNPRSTIYVVHGPPANTGLDLCYDDKHRGSGALREFIERYQPLLTLHGHIHESPARSGRVSERIGQTLSINPGSLLEYTGDRLNAVIVNPRDLSVEFIG